MRQARQRLAEAVTEQPARRAIEARSLPRDLLEAAAVAFESGFPARLLLPAEHSYVSVLRVKLQPAANPLGYFGGDECGAAAQERLIVVIEPMGN